MLRKFVFLAGAVTLLALLTTPRAQAWGAYHVGFTHVGPFGGVQHYGRTFYGGYGGFGGAYRYGGFGGYRDGAVGYRGLGYGGVGYLGYPYGGYYGGAYGGAFRAGYYRAW